MKDKNKISRYLSYILRHHPESIGLKLDKNGWAEVEELLSKIKYSINFSDLEEIVKTDNKQRYSFNDKKDKIRANQGHSINVDVNLERREPPDKLFHGTGEKSVKSILKDGLKPMGRLYVHLSKDTKTARKVGTRHGKPVIFEINTKRMKEDKIDFFYSKNKVWLVKKVAPKYLKILNG